MPPLPSSSPSFLLFLFQLFHSCCYFLDPGGQDMFDFPPKSDSVELTAKAVSNIRICELWRESVGCKCRATDRRQEESHLHDLYDLYRISNMESLLSVG